MAFLLTTACLVENQDIIDKLILSQTFLDNLASIDFDKAMDFLEDLVINNPKISDLVKQRLLEKDEMLMFDFMGTLASLGNI